MMLGNNITLISLQREHDLISFVCIGQQQQSDHATSFCLCETPKLTRTPLA